MDNRVQSPWVLERLLTGESTRLDEGVTTIGRNPSCTITISSDFVSRAHAEFVVDAGSENIQVRDLGSTNGIFVNEVVHRGMCRLKDGDRIGIGVHVDDDQLTLDGRYPMFVLKRVVPLVENGNAVPVEQAEHLVPEVIPPSPAQSDEDEDQIGELDVSESDYDDDDDEDDFVEPQGHKNMAMPSSCSLMDISKNQLISATINTIFGDLNPEMLKNLSEDARKIAQGCTSKHIPVKTEVGDDVICISSDEELDVKRQGNAKSPQLFDDSFNNDEGAPQDQNDKAVEPQKILLTDELATIKQRNEPEPVATLSRVDDVDENEEDELYFTQRLLDDLKDELPEAEDDEDAVGYNVDEGGTLIITPIKKEKCSQSVNDIINLDDEEYDKALEDNVNKWSQKLFSQSFSNSFNSSQVYEIEDDNTLPNTEDIFIKIEDDDEDVERPIKIEPGVVSPVTSDKEAEEQNATESPLVRQRKRSSNKNLLISSSSSDEDKAHKQTSSKKTLEKKVRTREPSISGELPKKKPRLSSRSEEHEKEDRYPHPPSSSSARTYSRISSENTDRVQAVDEVRDKLKNDRPTKYTSEGGKHSQSKDKSTLYRRSSSAPDETSSKLYMSATVAKREIMRNQSLVEEKEMDDFQENKKPEPAHTTLTKMIRGPPEIIQAPQLPISRGKLRGVSAVVKRCVEATKASHIQRDLKRKWLEKPSIAKRKEQEKCKEIKQDRKQKLKELADKKHSDTANSKDKISTTKNDQEKPKPKVKVTSVNRGAFLTEDMPPSGGIKSYKIPKKNTKSSSQSNKPIESTAPIPKPSCSKTTTQITTPTRVTEVAKSSAELPTNFAMELLNADVLPNNNKHAYRDRQKSTDVHSEQKARAPPRRNNKKLTFDAMEQHFSETKRIQGVQEKRAKASDTTSPIIKPTKKTVRFNDVPEIRYIETAYNFTRRVDRKEASTYNDRRIIIRNMFPIEEYFKKILLGDVLSWSQLWLQNKQTGFNMDGSDGIRYAMSQQFTSIEDYKNTVFPLLKIEYISDLERHMQRFASKPGYNVQISYLTEYENRDLIFTKCTSQLKSSELSVNDLVLIDIVINSKKMQYIGFIGNIRKAASCNCITIEVTRGFIAKNIVETAPQVTVRRIMEAMNVCLGSFSAVQQLNNTPLHVQILNPLKSLEVKTNRRPPIQYKGCDAMNNEQEEILLKIYAQAIDDFNPNISLIQGPPGTGKSRLITNLVLQLLYGNEVRMLDKKILICAQSNMAVDVIAQRLLVNQKRLSSSRPKYQVIRFGNDIKMHKDVRDITVRKLIERDHNARLQASSTSNEQTTMGENLKNEILKLEARVIELERECFQDVRQDELVQMRKNLALKKSIQNQTLRPEDERRLFASYLENANIICSTLSSCVKLSNYVDYFDVCIIDEATQCIEPWTIMPLKFGVNSLVLVGDTKQLPATIMSQKAKEYGLGTSLFKRIQNCFENNDNGEPSFIHSLHTQYRMHPEICKWPNMYFYGNQLSNNPTTKHLETVIKPFSILNLEYRQNEQSSVIGQIANSLEAEFVTKLVTTLDKYIPNKSNSYGVITPYSQHREKLETMIKSSGLHNIMVNTIDSYQGIEKDVIIISNARTHGVGFLADYQRLNVALTRSKKCLILCGSFRNLENVPSWASLLSNARERGLFHNISIADALDIENNVIKKIKR